MLPQTYFGTWFNFVYKLFKLVFGILFLLATKQTLLSIVLVNHALLRPISD